MNQYQLLSIFLNFRINHLTGIHEIFIEDSNLDTVPINSTFDNRELEQVIEFIKLTIDVEIEKQKGKYIIGNR